MKNISIQDTVSYKDFATYKQRAKVLRKQSAKKEFAHGTAHNIEVYFPGLLKLAEKTPDELIEESLVDSELGEERLDEYFHYLKKYVSHNVARSITFGTVQGFYSHNKVNTKRWS